MVDTASLRLQARPGLADLEQITGSSVETNAPSGRLGPNFSAGQGSWVRNAWAPHNNTTHHQLCW